MYKIVKQKYSEDIVCKSETLWIPMDQRNSDYQEYLKWVSEGNEAEVVDLTGEENE